LKKKDATAEFFCKFEYLGSEDGAHHKGELHLRINRILFGFYNLGLRERSGVVILKRCTHPQKEDRSQTCLYKIISPTLKAPPFKGRGLGWGKTRTFFKT
jgi:hypothetical protein